mmetsp:Transcript_86354/g.171429  ORF Transcript_86354/g.171429 Transcript_86354/m.171429 type:complete len:388 (-) Transcript_86354:419-1582(-)
MAPCSLQGLHGLLNLLFTIIVCIFDLLGNLFQQFLREDAQQGPRNVQRREYVAVFICTLGQKLGLKLVGEFQVLVLIFTQSLLTYNRLHGTGVLTNGIVGIQLIRNVWMICPSHALTNTRFHQAAQRWEHIDWRVNLAIVQRPVNEDLPLGDVACEVWDGVRDIVVGHRQDWELGDGTIATLDTACSFVDGRQICVHVTRVSSSTRHLLSCSRDFAKCIGIRRHVSQDDKDVLLPRVGEVFCCGQGKPRCHNALDCWIVRQVHEEHNVLHGSILLKVVSEKAGGLHVDTHGTEDYAKVLGRMVHNIFALHKGCLPAHLRCNFIVGKTSSREERQFLTSDHGIHGINCTDASLDHLFGVNARLWIQGRPTNVQVVLRQHIWTLVNRLA